MPDDLPNSPESRTETGEIKNVAAPAVPGNETVTPEPTPTETKAPEPEKKPESLLNKPEPSGAPDKYEDFKVPEGFELDEAVAKEAGDIFKGLNLSQTQAQQLIDFYATKTKEASEAPFKAYNDMRQEWQTATKADPDIGSKLAEVKQTVGRALDSLADPKLTAAFREAMDLTGAGDHPAFVKAFYKLAQKVNEGTAVRGAGPSKFGQTQTGRPESAAKAVYPNLS